MQCCLSLVICASLNGLKVEEEEEERVGRLDMTGLGGGGGGLRKNDLFIYLILTHLAYIYIESKCSKSVIYQTIIHSFEMARKVRGVFKKYADRCCHFYIG